MSVISSALCVPVPQAQTLLIRTLISTELAAAVRDGCVCTCVHVLLGVPNRLAVQAKHESADSKPRSWSHTEPLPEPHYAHWAQSGPDSCYQAQEQLCLATRVTQSTVPHVFRGRGVDTGRAGCTHVLDNFAVCGGNVATCVVDVAPHHIIGEVRLQDDVLGVHVHLRKGQRGDNQGG